MDEPPAESSAYPGAGDSSAYPSHNVSPASESEILRERVISHPKVKANRGLPEKVSAYLVCRGVPVHLELRHYYNTGRGRSSGMTMRNDMPGMLNSRREGGEAGSYQPTGRELKRNFETWQFKNRSNLFSSFYNDFKTISVTEKLDSLTNL